MYGIPSPEVSDGKMRIETEKVCGKDQKRYKVQKERRGKV